MCDVFYSPSDQESVTAEILLRTLINSTNLIMNVIMQKLKSNAGIFDNSYKAFENRGNQRINQSVYNSHILNHSDTNQRHCKITFF